MSSIPGMVAPGDLGRPWGCFCALGPNCLGRICEGSYWYQTERPRDEKIRGKVACGTSTRLCQSQKDLSRGSQNLQQGSQPTQEWSLVPMARMQPHLSGYRGEQCPRGSWLGARFVPLVVGGFTRTMVVLGWFPGAILESTLGLSFASPWETPCPSGGHFPGHSFGLQLPLAGGREPMG